MIGEDAARTLAWDGCLNVRDLGGIATEDGGRTKHGRVIRSDSVGKLTRAGWLAVEDHGVSRIVDLRFPEEVREDPPRDVDVEVVNISVLGPSALGGSDYVRKLEAHLDSVDDVADHYAWSYGDFLERNHARFAAALAAVADADGAVVIHCAGGKDRTGIVAALLLRLAGVSAEEIGRDYAFSGPNLAVDLDEWLASAPDERERSRREKLSKTPAVAMARVIEALEEQFGSVEAYLEAGGVEPGQIERLRGRLR